MKETPQVPWFGNWNVLWNYCCAEEKIPVGTEHLEVNDRENVAYWKCLGSKVVVIRGKLVALSEFI